MTRITAETKLKAPISRRPLASPTNIRASQTHSKSFSTRFPASPVSNHHPARVSENNIYFAPFDEDDRMSVDESHSDDELGEWIDGETLIAIEDVGNTEKKDDLEDKIALVNSLAEPYAKHMTTLKYEVVETMSPVLKHAHLVLSHISNQIIPDKLIRGGLQAHEAASEEWENTVQDQLLEFTEAIEESQNKIKALFSKLRAEEERREEWWERYAALIDQAATTGEEVATDSLATTNKTISLADKKIKAMYSDGGVTKNSKKAAEMDKLKALMLNL